jgi:hypothetical protein
MPLQLGDVNESVRQWRIVMNQRFGPLYTRLIGPMPTDTGEFGPRAKAWQQGYERRTNQPVDGIVSDNDLRALRVPVPPVKPLCITVEGHMSDMWIGPAVATGQQLEREGLVQLQPTGYNNTSIPFDNESGVQEVVRFFRDPVLMPRGRKWCLFGFSQGEIVTAEFLLRYVFPEGAEFHDRMGDWICSLEFGAPYREKDQCAPWIADPPKKGTQGISGKRLYGGTWNDRLQYVVRKGDLYTENEDNHTGELKTTVYDMVQGDPKGILLALLRVGLSPTTEIVAIIQAIMSGGLFLFNMGPHGTYDLRPVIDWARSKVKAATAT